MSSPAVAPKRAWPAAWHLILFALIVAIPLLLLVGVLLNRSVTAERETLERRIVQAMEALVADVDRDIERHITILRTLATSPSLTAEDWPDFYGQAKASLETTGYLVLLDVENRQIFNTYVPYGQAPALSSNPEVGEEMKRTRQPIVSDLFMSISAKQFVYSISIPIIRDGQLRYVLSLGLLPANLSALIESQKVQANWTMTIIDRKGVVMARAGDHGRRVGTRANPERLDRHPGQIFSGRTIDNRPVLFVTGKSALSGWTISVSYPAELVEREVQRSLLIWGSTITIVAAVIVILGLAFGSGFTHPLAAATAAAQALGRGQPISVRDSRLREANAVNHALMEAQVELHRRQAALRESEAQLRSAAEAAQFGAHQYDVVNDRAIRSPQFRRMIGADENSDPTFKGGLRFVHPDDRYEVELRKRQIIESEGDYQLTYRIRRPDREVRWVMDRGTVVRDTGGKPIRVVGVLLDITDLKEAELRQRLLFDELNHRVKNTLAIVQSLAQQTLRSKPEPAEFALAFGSRLASLARAHDLLTRDSWQGAELKRIVQSALEPFADDLADGRIRIGGPAVSMPANATITLCLMLHELATNAAKYGALSVEAGRLSIEWTAVTNGGLTTLDLHWREEHGPKIVAPVRKGFGSRLLAASAMQLNAELSLDYLAEGLVCRVRFDTVRSPGEVR